MDQMFLSMLRLTKPRAEYPGDVMLFTSTCEGEG